MKVEKEEERKGVFEEMQVPEKTKNGMLIEIKLRKQWTVYITPQGREVHKAGERVAMRKIDILWLLRKLWDGAVIKIYEAPKC